MTTVAPPPHVFTEETLRVSEEEQRRFDEDGFFLVENALSQQQIDAVIAITDEYYEQYKNEHGLGPNDPFQLRNIIATHPLYRDLISHEDILSRVVDVIGYNLQIRTSHADVRPPMRAEDTGIELGARDSFFPWHADGPNYGWPTINGVIPYMEVKVAYYLTDLSEHNSGAICVVRGSHCRPIERDENGNVIVDPAEIVEVNVEPGTAMLWRTSLLHCVTPNLSQRTRKCLYYGYSHRWVRPSDYDHQPASALEGCTPVQRQLLGELGSGKTNYNGDEPETHPVSRYWRPQEEDIPLKAWAEQKLQDRLIPG